MASFHESDFIPATWWYITWYVVYFWQVVWVVCDECSSRHRWACCPPLANSTHTMSFLYILLSVANLCTLAWFHLAGLGLQLHALAAIAVAAAILQGVVYVSDRRLCSDVIPQHEASRCPQQKSVPAERCNRRLLWHCGLDLYATWVAIVTVGHVADLLVMVAGLRVSTVHSVAHGTLLFLLLARFSFDSLVFPKVPRHRVTPYLVVMATMMAVLQTNWHAASRTWEWCVLTVTCLMVAMQTVLTCALRHRGVPLEQIA